MAAGYTITQTHLVNKVVVLCLVTGTVWLFKDKIRYHTYQRAFAWIMNKITPKVNQGLKQYKTHLFKFVTEYRERINKDLNVLEVGCGTCTNLAYLPPNTKLVCLDPNPHFAGYIKSNLEKADTVISAEIVQGYAEKIPLESSKYDVVISTLVMCSVRSVGVSLEEIKRVLKPGGIFVFLEHEAAEKHTLRWVAHCVVYPLHWIFGDGCEEERDVEKSVKAAGFSKVLVEKFFPKAFPFWGKPCILGTATK